MNQPDDVEPLSFSGSEHARPADRDQDGARRSRVLVAVSTLSIAVSIGYFISLPLLFQHFIGRYSVEDLTAGNQFGLGVFVGAMYIVVVVPVNVLFVAVLLLCGRRQRSRRASVMSIITLILAVPALLSALWIF